MKTRLLTLFLLLCLALSACVPAPTAALASPPPTAANTATAASTPLPDPTITLTPAMAQTATPTEEPAYSGALSTEQRERLAAAAQAYISPMPEEAFATAIRLDYIGRNANPATMCGPLALAILRDTGLIEPDTPLISFYYLNPRPGHDERRVQGIFPPERFEKIVQEESIGRIDFSAQPLYPGDFLYLFAGDSGSFEHMLVVSRVDETGRAFSVTNVNTPWGFIVDEVMLYDPALPGVGQFYEWTNRENTMIGRTGYGGFWLWRLRETP